MSEKKEVVFYADGRHSSVYIYEPPMDERIYTAPIDELVDLGIDTITYAVGDCRVLLYDTKVGERWGHNVKKANHLIWYRGGLNLEQFIAAGKDPLEVVCRRAHQVGFNFLPSLILGMQYQEPAEATDCRCSDFCFEHPEYQVGSEPDIPEARWDDPTRFSYAIPEVRHNRLAVIEELVSAYDTDGIELNITDYTPFLARREIPEHTDTFTEFIVEARRLCDRAAAAQNREKRLLVRAGASLAGCKAVGIDLETLIRDEIAHGVLAMIPHTQGLIDPNPAGIAELVRAARGKNVKIIDGISNAIHHDAYHYPTREMQVAQASNAYGAGADGAFFSTYYPNGYPYADSDLASIRFMGRPELLAHKDKHYVVRQGANGPDDTPGNFLSPNPLPVELKVGEEGAEQTFHVEDDLAAKHTLGEVAKCELRVRICETAYDDTYDLWFNGELVPRQRQEWIDWTYSVRPVPGQTRVLDAYWITVDLKQGDLLPHRGENSVRVDLKTHDPRCYPPVLLHDVELVVQYRDHRHAPRRDEWWHDPRAPIGV